MSRSLLNLFLLSTLILSGCVHTEKQPQTATVKVSALAFFNATNDVIHNVKLSNPANGNMVGCQLVQVQQHCGTGFPSARYQGTELIVSWLLNSGQTRQQTVFINLPQNIDPNIAYLAVIKFNADGSIAAFMRDNPRVF